MMKAHATNAVIAERFADAILDIHPNECLVKFVIPDEQHDDVVHEFENRGFAVTCADHFAIARRQHHPRRHSPKGP